MTNKINTSLDSYGRKIDYLRISITDRCNLRCFYCMPPSGVEKLDHHDILSFEDIEKITKAAVDMGVSKVRFTGGEPLVRKDFSDLVKSISKLPTINDISLTTNGILLAEQVDDLYSAGLNRVNISLDTLKQTKFYEITGVDGMNQVFRGIDKAIETGLTPVKINVVVIKGMNQDEIKDFARLTYYKPLEIRFIEYMPVGESNNWSGKYLSSKQIRDICSELGELSLTDSKQGSGPASYYKLAGARGKLGFISAISDHFCDTCNRIRLTSDGKLKSCLFSDKELDITGHLESEQAIQELLARSLETKPKNHNINMVGTEGELQANRSARGMSQIGG